MPPYPRNAPALEVADPRHTRRPGGHGWRSGNREPWTCLFGDGERRNVRVLAWWEDDRGQTIVQLEWRAEHSTWSEAFLFAADKLRDE